MNIDKEKLIKSLLIIFSIIVLIAVLSRMASRNSKTLSEYADENPDLNFKTVSENESVSMDNITLENESDYDKEQNFISDMDKGIEQGDSNDMNNDNVNENLQNETNPLQGSLIGAKLNGASQIDKRMIYTDYFYYEPISEELAAYIKGVSFPVANDELDNLEKISCDEIINVYDDYSSIITLEALRYVHVLHYDFEGNVSEGELICNEAIAKDLVEIFFELYKNEYQIEKIRLIDEYMGDDEASMVDNNSSSFNFRCVAGTSSISNHAYGLAIDINPLYNPYITYKNGAENIAPVGSEAYADRSQGFPYKIDSDDLCYKLFTEHGFTWGGNWNSSKDYQHFQKTQF